MNKLQEMRERAAKMIAEVRANGGTANEQFGKEITAVNEEIATEEGKQRVADNRAAAPQNTKETIDAARAETERVLREQEQVLSSALDMVEHNAKEAAELRAAIKEINVKMARRHEFDVNNGKPEFTRDFHRTLLTTPTNDEQIRNFQEKSDTLMMLNSLLAYRGKHTGADGILPGVKSFRDFRTFKELDKEVRALYSTGVGSGAEWMPDVMSNNLFEKYEQERRLPSMIPSVPMPAGSTVWPLLESNPTVYLQGERTNDDGAAYRGGALTTAERAMAPKTIAGRLVWSTDTDEDSVIMVAPTVAQRYGKSIARALEHAIINGDTTATHQDTGETVASDDVRRAWAGLRKLCLAAAKMDLSTWSAANVGKLFNLLGELASDPAGLVFVPSNKAYWMKMVADTNFTDASKLPQGMQPSHVSGVVGKYFGADVVPSSLIAENQNATGIYDNSTTTYTSVLVFRPDQYVIGERRGMTIETDKHIASGQIEMVCTMRAIFKKLANNTTVASEAIGYKIS